MEAPMNLFRSIVDEVAYFAAPRAPAAGAAKPAAPAADVAAPAAPAPAPAP